MNWLQEGKFQILSGNGGDKQRVGWGEVLAPPHGAPERSFGRVVGRLHALGAEKGEKLFKMLQQRQGEVADTLIATIP